MKIFFLTNLDKIFSNIFFFYFFNKFENNYFKFDYFCENQNNSQSSFNKIKNLSLKQR